MMSQTPFLTIEFKDAGAKSFATKEDLVEWLKGEISFWSWALKTNPIELGLIDDKRKSFIADLQNARNTFARDGSPEVLAKAEKALQQYARSGLVSQTARAQFIEGLQRGDSGEIVAQAALAEYLGSARDANPARQNDRYRYPSARGRVAIALFDAGVDKDAVAAVAQSVGEMSQNFSQTLNEHLSTYEDVLAELKAKVEVVKTESAETEQARAAQLISELSAFVAQKNEALKEIHDTRLTYMEHMRIGATVEYWRDKGKNHAANARWWLKFLTWYAVLGFVVLSAAFVFAFYRANEAASVSPGTFDRVFLLETAGLAALVTVLFWVARFLSRLFLSERHMSIDAQQRAVMAEAFLALSNEGKVEAADRALVLQPLFRAGGDGIIRDDGGLDGVLAMIARSLEKPTGTGR